MPAVTVPTLTSAPDYIKTGNSSTTLSTSFRCSKFEVSNNHRITVSGDVVIVVSETFVVENYSRIELAAGARLTIYALKDAKFQDNCSVNMNTWDPARFVFYKMGTQDMFLQNGADVCGTFVCPQGRVVINNNADLFGWMTSKNLTMQNSAGLHVPAEAVNPPCSVAVDDNPSVLGAADSAGVSSGSSFGQWFADVPGVNESAQARMLFSKDDAGAWEFETNDFRPIDGELLAEGAPGPNRNFTLDLNGRFEYTPCSGQFFEFEGDGDALVYVDGKLVLELSGNSAGVGQHLDLDRLGLDPATPHTLQFFYAQRSCSPSRFHVRTSVNLDTTYIVKESAVSAHD